MSRTMKTRTKSEYRHGQPRMTRIARMEMNFCPENPEAIRPEPHQRNAFLIRVIREIRGFNFGSQAKNLFLVPALIAVLSLLPAGRATAQTFTTLHSFTATSTNSSGAYTNSEGAGPAAALISNSTGDTLYGTAEGGGGSGGSTVFAVHTDGTAFTAVHSFLWSDGANPQAELLLSGHTLYGTASGGGDGGGGTVFAINTDGTGFTTLHSF